MSLLESSALRTTPAPLAATRLPSQEYALALAATLDAYAVAASSPTNALYLIDKSTLKNVSTLPGHAGAITGLRAVDSIGGAEGGVLVSSGRDGAVKVWDTRSRSVGLQMSAPGHALLAFDVAPDGRTLAAGTDLAGDDALVLFFDPRAPRAPLHTHSATHSDDVTAVHFHAGGGTLLTASSDGLVCTSRAGEADEDEAVLHVGNWGCSVAQAGWVRVSAGAQVWAASDMETFSCWTGELDLLQSQDIRKPSAHSQSLTWVTDYLIGCHNASTAGGSAGLGVFVGSNEGDVALITSSHLSNAEAPWSLERLWTHGHVGVVRSVLWDESNNVLLTGGEDAIVNAWTCPPLVPSSSDDDAMDVDMEGPESPGASRKRGWDARGGEDEGGKKARRA
ncbi:hypothetical protein HWV62_28948 [Athelia sp. TMB]|nr:hypothetical protein HWV62_28948 [Athelia sp. TMB]